MITAIGNIYNEYGELYAKEHEGKYYWIIENYNTNFNNIEQWEEISKELYDELIKHNNRF